MWKKRMLAGLLALAAALSIALPAAAQEGEQPARRFAQPDFDVPCRAAMLICWPVMACIRAWKRSGMTSRRMGPMASMAAASFLSLRAR